MLTLISHLGNLAELAYRVGDWDLGRHAVEQILALESSSIDRAMALELAITMRTLEGADVADLLAEAATAVAVDEPALDRVATMEFLAGHYPSAGAAWAELARLSPLNAPLCLPKAARAARFAGDVAGTRSALDALRAQPVRGPVIDAESCTIEAGIAAMDGRVEEARRLFRDARERWQELRLPWDEALCCLDMAMLLGPDDPDVPAAAVLARATMERLGARPFLAILDRALGAPTHVPAEATA